MIKAILVSLLVLIATIVQAQESDPIKDQKKHYVYFNPGALINVPSGFQVGYDRNIFKNTHWDIQGGPLLFAKNPTFNDFNATNKKGLRFQTGLKNYLSSRFYIGPQFLFKRVTMDEKIWFERFDNAYEQRLEVKRYRRTFALAVEVGWEYQFEDSPMLFEIAYDLGIQSFRVRYSELPMDVNLNNLRGIGIDEGDFIYPFFNYCIKLKFALGSSIKSKEEKSGK